MSSRSNAAALTLHRICNGRPWLKPRSKIARNGIAEGNRRSDQLWVFTSGRVLDSAPFVSTSPNQALGHRLVFEAQEFLLGRVARTSMLDGMASTIGKELIHHHPVVPTRQPVPNPLTYRIKDHASIQRMSATSLILRAKTLLTKSTLVLPAFGTRPSLLSPSLS